MRALKLRDHVPLTVKEQRVVVFRLQHKTSKQGPYRGSDTYFWATRRHNGPRHPSPLRDKKLAKFCQKSGLAGSYQTFVGPSFRFGFKDGKGLRSWFNERELKKLSRLGFELVAYQVSNSHVVEGDKQIMFIFSKAKRLKTLSLVSLINKSPKARTFFY